MCQVHPELELVPCASANRSASLVWSEFKIDFALSLAALGLWHPFSSVFTTGSEDARRNVNTGRPIRLIGPIRSNTRHSRLSRACLKHVQSCLLMDPLFKTTMSNVSVTVNVDNSLECEPTTQWFPLSWKPISIENSPNITNIKVTTSLIDKT